MANVEKLAKKLDFHGMIVASMTTALVFVAGLFWRDAIQQFISEVLPEGEGLFYSFAVAMLVTIGVVVTIFVLVKTQNLRAKAREKILARRNIKKPVKKKK